MEPRNANYGVSDVFWQFRGLSACMTSDLHFVAHDVLHVELIRPRQRGGQTPSRSGTRGGAGAYPSRALTASRWSGSEPATSSRCRGPTPARARCTGFRFSRVVGRSDDNGGGARAQNMFPTMVAAVIGAFPELSGDYRIVLDPRRRPTNTLPVQAELARGRQDDGTLARRLEAALKSRLGATATPPSPSCQTGAFP